MSTRGTIGFVVNEDLKVTYNHSDSYPSELGKNMVEFIKSGWDMKSMAERIELVDADSTPTPEQISHCKSWTDLDVSSRDNQDWYCLLRGTHGNLRAYHGDLKYMIDGRDFLADSLFCEYAYLINLHSNKLEFYEGFNKDPKAPGVFARLKVPDYTTDAGRLITADHYGVKLVKEYSFDEILNSETAAIVAEMEKLTEE